MSENKAIMEYRADSGAPVKLSPGVVRSYLTRGGGRISDQEIMMFMMLCRDQGLNPFLNEVYLIKYGSNDPAQMTTSYDVFKQRAMRHPLYQGHNAGTICVDKSGEAVHRAGCMVYPGDEVIGGWCSVERKDMVPLLHEVSFNEYVGRKSNGDINRMWASKPGTMIRKVAVSQALREAFPESMQGLYTPEEYGRAQEEVPSVPIDITPEPEIIEIETPQEPQEEAYEDAS